ncbi:MAG: c-type cytochrome [Rhodospirillales bacterium]|nr:c-type cytochrome [Rhodospirillales bacterium]QQS14515.1 MAG: c-type cytochrome [Rhodospirillales bacterium]
MRHPILLAATTAAALLAAAAAGAQEHGQARRGLALAQMRCAACHAVDATPRRSPRLDAPAFATIAATPGMTATALLASLQTSHQTMPDLILEPDDMADVIAHILSLGTGR